MKRNFVVGLFGSFVGFGMLLILLGATGIAGAQSGDVQSNVSHPAEVSAATPLTSTFTYQGQLKNGGNPITATCDFQFGLWDSLSGGAQLGITQTLSAVSVNAGYFTTLLNSGNPFGINAFNGSQRWLGITVRCPAGSGAYSAFNQRQPLTATPFASYSAAPWVTGINNTIYYNNGSVSIGTASPLAGYKLEVDGATRLATGGSGGEILLAAPNGETGLTIKGTNRADVRFDGTTLKLLTGLGTGAPASTNGIVIDTGGNVGLGTSGANNRLTVAGAANIASFLRVGGNTGGAGLAGDVVARRSATTGAYYFGDSINNYLFFDGTNYRFGQSGLYVNTNGNVGIGTSSPLTPLHVKGNTAFSGNNTAVFENTAIGPNVSAIHYGTTGDWYVRSASASGRVIIQDTGGNVGIGTSNPTARLEVRSSGTTFASYSLAIYNGNGNDTLVVDDGGRVRIGALASEQSAGHVCINNRFLSDCQSAAEYVPSIDSGVGFPETADLVSIAPAVANPYGDDHGPFVVAKSTLACDENLLGYIVRSESGADGKKLNDHYLPLAIYGYFPANVTLENGAIKRGDPITSSSKPGYGMKATRACKIIGYALEDADHEGTIQVFANHGESTAPAVTALQAQVRALTDQNAALDARLAALEKTMGGQAQPQSLPAPLDKRGTP